MDGVLSAVTDLISLATSAFHMYTGMFGTVLMQKIIHLGLICTIAFLSLPFSKKRQQTRFARWVNLLIISMNIAVTCYLLFNYTNLSYSIGAPTAFQTALGLALVLLVLELTRRTMGMPLVIIAACAILYGLAGPYLPGLLRHRGFSLQRIVTYLYLSNDGIYGPALAATANFVALFVILGSFLERSGVGGYFMDVASQLLARARGGPAKVAVVASALYGTLSGSSTANVVTTGSFTIPLMKKTGYSAEFAGAVEAVASTGGQLMPPIMGSVAFVMAEIIGVGYNRVMAAALIPAILYYMSLYFMVDLRAISLGLKGRHVKLDLKGVLKGSYKLIPIVLIVYLLTQVGLSLMRTAVWAIVATIAISWLSKDTRMGWSRIADALKKGAKGTLVVASASACAGIVIGIVNLTGLGLRLSGVILSLSHGNLLVTLVLTMLSCLILGMGLPTLASYLIMAVLAVPALLQLGVSPMAAHLFVMYYACLSSITPPVALASYAAAGISGGSVWKTGWTAVRIGIAAFIVPFMAVYSPRLLMEGSFLEVIWAVISASVGIYCLASAMEGRLPWAPVRPILRVSLLAAALMLIDQSATTDMIGFGILLANVLFMWGLRSREGR